MKNDKKNLNRRDFFKMVGAAGIGSAFAFGGFKEKLAGAEIPSVDKKGDAPRVPRRRLGKTNVSIPCLAHGVMYNLVENQIVIYNGLKWGINMIDTSHGYAGGNSELGIGKFFGKNPEKRKEFFIVSKASRAKSVAEIEEKLQLSLQRMKTNYIDLYYGVHALNDPADLTDELRKWAEGAKKRKLIKYFGFSTHQNMAKCLKAASKLRWIDALMTSYNFRLMQDPEMKEAIDACYKAGIGIIAMKVMGLDLKTDDDKRLVNSFVEKGITEAQAKLKAVLDDKRIASACVTMNTVEHVSTNASAVIDSKKLTSSERNILNRYALANCGSYCAGCSEICDHAMPEVAPYISDIMRYLMYYNSYNEREMARGFFAEIPAPLRRRLTRLDYTAAEKRCPQGLPIRLLIAEAVQKLA
jgi:predicted aldo/keto reductase-like oxidoreductase